jgi:hypothetical protein
MVTRTQRATAALVPAGLVLAVFLLHWPSLRAPVSGLDEGTLLAYPTRVFASAVPYRSFVTFYGPANPYVIGAAMQLFGAHLIVERLIGIGYVAMLVLAWYALPLADSPRVRGAVALVLCAGTTALGPQATCFTAALAAVLAAIALAARADMSRPRLRFLLAGLCLGVACLYRLDFLPCAIVVAAVLVWRRERRLRVAVAVGLSIGIALLVAVVAVAGVGNFFSTLEDWRRSAPARYLPFPGGAIAFMLVVAVLGAVAVFTAGARLVRAESGLEPRSRSLLALGATLCLLIPYALSRSDQVHVGTQYDLIAVLLLTGVVTRARASGLQARDATRWSLLAVFLAACALGPSLDPLQSDLRALVGHRPYDTVAAGAGGRQVLLSPPTARAVSVVLRVIDELDIRSPRIWVGPSDLETSYWNETYFYYLLPHARPVSRYWESEPGTANRVGSPLRRELPMADLLILDSADNSFPGTASAPGAVVRNGLNQLVGRDFCRVVSAGAFELLRRCRRGLSVRLSDGDASKRRERAVVEVAAPAGSDEQHALEQARHRGSGLLTAGLDVEHDDVVVTAAGRGSS